MGRIGMNLIRGIRAFSVAVRGRQADALRQAQGERAEYDGGFTHGFGELASGGATGWAPTTFGEYYPRSAIVYAAIKVRQDAIARLPLRVLRTRGANRMDRIGGGRGSTSSPRAVNARAGGEPGGRGASVAAAAGLAEPVLEQERPLAGNGDLPVIVGRGVLGAGAGRAWRYRGDMAAAPGQDARDTGPEALYQGVRVHGSGQRTRAVPAG